MAVTGRHQAAIRHTGAMTSGVAAPGTTPVPLRTSFRSQVRQRALEVALEQTVERGWDGVRMSRVAELAGVSRPTLYKEFGDKQGLADALGLAEAHRFVGGAVDALQTTPGGPVTALHAAVDYCLGEAHTSPLLHEVLSSSGAQGLLPQLTTRASPIRQLAVAGLTPWFAAHFPGLGAEALDAVVDTLVRLVISHVVMPAPDGSDPGSTILGVSLLMLGDADPG